MYLSIGVRNINIAKNCLDCNKYEIIVEMSGYLGSVVAIAHWVLWLA